jgi:hypothetical protein
MLFTGEPELTLDAIKCSKAVLYAACYSVSTMEKESDSSSGILCIASYVLGILRFKDLTETADGESELVQLQTGCIEFLARCLEAFASCRSQNRGITSSGASTPSVQPIQDVGSVNVVSELALLYSSLVSILMGKVPKVKWIRNYASLPNGIELQEASWSSSARICIWNAFLVVSQRAKDEMLDVWAKMTLPWLVTWGSSKRVSACHEQLHHPLCEAAALQVAFIIITRTKSFDCLAGFGSDQSTIPGKVREIHKWSVQSINSKESNIGEEYAGRTLRAAALKLMLAIVSIDQTSHEHSIIFHKCLGPSELAETFHTLKSTASIDHDPAIRRLAHQLAIPLQTLL